jgi:hypothetical protein
MEGNLLPQYSRKSNYHAIIPSQDVGQKGDRSKLLTTNWLSSKKVETGGAITSAEIKTSLREV